MWYLTKSQKTVILGQPLYHCNRSQRMSEKWEDEKGNNRKNSLFIIIKGFGTQASRDSCASVTGNPNIWNIQNKSTCFLASFTQAHILTHRKEEGKDNHFHKQPWCSNSDPTNPPSLHNQKTRKKSIRQQFLDNGEQ